MDRKALLAGLISVLVLFLLPATIASGEVSHPRVMFGRKDIPVLRAKMKTEPWAAWYKEVKKQADENLRIETAKITGFNSRWGSLALAFVYTIEGDRKYALKCRDILLAMPSEVIASRKTNAVRRSYSGTSYPLAYDMIYDALTPAERKRIEERIRTALVSMVRLAKTPHFNGNIRSVYTVALGTMGLALNDRSWVDQARTTMEGTLNNCIKGKGAFNEGQGYSGMRIGELFQLMAALRRRPGEKDCFQHPQVKKFLDFCVLSASPLGTLPCFEDSSFGDSGISMLFRACGQLPAPEHSKVYHWLKKRYETFGRPVRVGGNAHIDGILLDLMLVDRLETETAEPWEVSGVYPGAGLAFLRSGWDPEALYLAISCKTYNSGPHCHGDENSIELWAYGAYLLANAGYPSWEDKRHWWCATTEASNAILINGKGQLERRCNARRADGFGGSVLTDFIDYIEARGSRLYADGGFNRNVLFVRPTAEIPGYYILIDRIKTTKADASVDWILHGRGSLKVTPYTARWKVKSFVTKKPVTLTARIIEPQITIIRQENGYNAMDKKEIPYIMVRPQHPGPRTFVTVLYPTKEKQRVPRIMELSDIMRPPAPQGATIGGTDLVLSQEGNREIKAQEAETDASICFLRKKQDGLDYFFVTDSSYLKYRGKTVFSSPKPVAAAFRYTKEGVSGAINAVGEISVSLPLAKHPNSVKVNDKKAPVAYSQGVLTLTLKKGGNSISISY